MSVGRPINIKCKQCSERGRLLKAEHPNCWDDDICPRRRSHYKYHEKNKRKIRERHRYLKYRGNKCALCTVKNDRLQVHHVVPQSKGGLDAKFNTLTLCEDCHKLITKYYFAIGWQ